jgi:hypothetical protein
MITIHNVIPHPGFLRDAGSPEQVLNIRENFFAMAVHRTICQKAG